MNAPLHAAGIRSDPPPSLPCAIGRAPVATTTAAPADDPPDVRLGSHGLRQGPAGDRSVSNDADSGGTEVAPKTTTPASRNRSATTAVVSAMRPASSRVPSVADKPAISHLQSLRRYGTPVNGPSGRPSAICRRAKSSYRSASTPNWRSTASTLSIASSSSSVGEMSPERTSSASPRASWSSNTLSVIAFPHNSCQAHRISSLPLTIR